MKKVRRRIWPVFIMLMLVLSMSLPGSFSTGSGSLAAPPEPEDKFGGFTIELDVGEDGDITLREVSIGELSLELPTDEEEPMTIEFGGLKLKNVSTEALGAVLEKFDLEVEIPEIGVEPEQVKVFTDHEVQHVAVHKVSHGAFQEVGVFVNNLKALEAKMSDEVVDTILAESGLEEAVTELLTPVLMMEEATIIVRFPGAEEEVSFADEIETEYGAAMNRIEVGATIAGTKEAGEFVSAGGITILEANELLEGMGTAPILGKLLANPLAILDAKQLTTKAGRNGLWVEDNNGRFVEVAWDKESRAAIYDLVPLALDLAELAESPIQEMYTEILTDTISLVEGWLPNTEVEFVLHNATGAKEDLPTVHIGQQLTLELNEDRELTVEGVPVGEVFLDYETLEPLLPTAVCIDFANGKRKEARATINGKPLPSVFLGEHAVTEIGSVLAESLAEDVPGLEKVPWEKVDTLLGGIHVEGVVFAVEGEVPEELGLDYAAAEEPLKDGLRIVPRVTLDHQGHIAIGGTRLTPFLGAAAAQITETVSLVAAYVPTDTVASVTVGPNAILVELNNETLVGISWDSKLRGNLLGIATEAADIDLPEFTLGLVTFLPDWEETITDKLAGKGWGRWGLEVEIVEEIPPSSLERFAARLGWLKLPETETP